MSEKARPDDAETIDRNWDELLQEIRVTETGAQILTGFLLTVPFAQRFTELDHLQRTTYLVVLCGSVLTTALVVAPAAFHRVLFRHRARRWLVEAANRCARAGLALMALTISGSLFLIFDLVAGTGPALAVLAVALLLFASLWVVVPLSSRRARNKA
ncbi:MAG: sodium:proton antiporter [Marmoricola sp.]|nr:sodium:proton antiporter [Marmoricola sp.]